MQAVHAEEAGGGGGGGAYASKLAKDLLERGNCSKK